MEAPSDGLLSSDDIDINASLRFVSYFCLLLNSFCDILTWF